MTMTTTKSAEAHAADFMDALKGFTAYEVAAMLRTIVHGIDYRGCSKSHMAHCYADDNLTRGNAGRMAGLDLAALKANLEKRREDIADGAARQAREAAERRASLKIVTFSVGDREHSFFDTNRQPYGDSDPEHVAILAAMWRAGWRSGAIGPMAVKFIRVKTLKEI